MTSNDAQIDVLLRRYAGRSPSNAVSAHLDADELNAFAEGSLPEAARSRYVSHLVDCDNCRQIVSQLAISRGAVTAAEASTARERSGYSWGKRFSGFFSPLTLRYAAFAMVLIAAAGAIFLVTRRPRESNLLAQNEQASQAPASAVKPNNDATPQTGSASQFDGNQNKQGSATNPERLSKSAPSSDQTAKLDQSKFGDNPASPPKAAKEAESISTPALAASKKAESPVNETVPSYAPPPPVAGQRAQIQSRQQQNAAGVASKSGPRQSEQSKDQFKVMGRPQTAETGKEIPAQDDVARVVVQPPASKRASDEKAKGPRRDIANNATMNRNANETRADTAKSQAVVTLNRAASEEKPPETLSAGGHKFRRQANAWVDMKFKSSMSVKVISRGSSEYDSLDSGVRSIAQQLGGEVIVVRKGKAYLIR